MRIVQHFIFLLHWSKTSNMSKCHYLYSPLFDFTSLLRYYISSRLSLSLFAYSIKVLKVGLSDLRLRLAVLYGKETAFFLCVLRFETYE